MDSKPITNLLLIAVVLVAFYLIYDNITTSKQFKKKFDAIQSQRDSLRHSLQDLITRSDARDKELKELIGENLRFIESLNDALNKKTKVSQEIQNDIKVNKNKIDSLWLINS